LYLKSKSRSFIIKTVNENKIAVTALRLQFYWLAVLVYLGQMRQQSDTRNKEPQKKVVVQVFLTLEIKNTTNKPWGTIAENGVESLMILLMSLLQNKRFRCRLYLYTGEFPIML
jgi:hypothetical protein